MLIRVTARAVLNIVTNFVDPAERGALRCSERRLPCDL